MEGISQPFSNPKLFWSPETGPPPQTVGRGGGYEGPCLGIGAAVETNFMNTSTNDIMSNQVIDCTARAFHQLGRLLARPPLLPHACVFMSLNAW